MRVGEKLARHTCVGRYPATFEFEQFKDTRLLPTQE